MSFLESTHKSGWITDLVLPRLPPNSTTTAHSLLETGQKVAVQMCSDPIFMARLNPLVQSVDMIPSTDPKAVDYRAMAKAFGLDIAALIRENQPESVVADVYDQDPAADPDAVAKDRTHPVGEFRQYSISDKLTPLPLLPFTTTLVYHSAILRTPSGMITFTNPGSGVSIYGDFSITIAQGNDNAALDASDGKGWVLNFVERNETKANVVLMGYIRSTTDKSHRAAHGRFKEEWRERMKARGFDFG